MSHLILNIILDRKTEIILWSFFGQEALKMDYGIVHRYINFMVEECGGTSALVDVCICLGIGQDMLVYTRSISDLAIYVTIIIALLLFETLEIIKLRTQPSLANLAHFSIIRL